MNLNKEAFDQTIDGKPAGLYVLDNKNIQAAITNFGARIVSIIVKDKQGQPVDVVTGFDNLSQYLTASEPFHGAIVGRYANRIARGRFSLDGVTYHLPINNPPNHLHGGPNGFHNQVWTVEASGDDFLRLSYESKDGEEGYPGNVRVELEYRLNKEDGLEIHYKAKSDKPTVFNITSHPFFNLNGQGLGNILDHLLQIEADTYTPVDDSLIPTGISSVEQTPFDFQTPTTIGAKINQPDVQLKYGAGYDHNFVLKGSGLRRVASVKGDKTDISMEVITDQPGMQLYTGNYMKGENRIKYGLKDDYRAAFCLETQHFPDSPNHPEFPSTTLLPGKLFESTTIYKFS